MAFAGERNKKRKKENKNKIRLYGEGKRLVDKAYFESEEWS